MNQSDLKKLLKNIRADEYRVPEGVDVSALGQTLLENIGCLDPELRDSLVYPVLQRWIYLGTFNNEQKLEIARVLLGEDYLLNSLGEVEGDAVFTRAFSVLQFAVILYAHREKPFLPSELLMGIYENLLKLLTEEADLRGYVLDKGWAHCVAHTADAVDELALCEEFGKSELERILIVIRQRIFSDIVFTHEEDERLLTAVMSVFSRNLFSEQEIIARVQSFSSPEKTYGKLPESYYNMLNRKNFLRAMYFRVIEQSDYAYLLPVITETLKGLIVR